DHAQRRAGGEAGGGVRRDRARQAEFRARLRADVRQSAQLSPAGKFQRDDDRFTPRRISESDQGNRCPAGEGCRNDLRFPAGKRRREKMVQISSEAERLEKTRLSGLDDKALIVKLRATKK